MHNGIFTLLIVFQEVLGRLSEDSEDGGPQSSSYPTSHTFPWQQPPHILTAAVAPAPNYGVEAAAAADADANEDDEQPLELVKKKQEPMTEGRCSKIL